MLLEIALEVESVVRILAFSGTQRASGRQIASNGEVLRSRLKRN